MAGVTYQIAVSVDLLVAGRAGREAHPPVTSVVPEGWEDVDCEVSPRGRLHVQAKERGFTADPLGLSDLASAVAHATPSLLGPDGDVEIDFALVTDGRLRPGLAFTGWGRPIAAILSDEPAGADALTSLAQLLKSQLAESGLDPALATALLAHTFVVYRPWHVSADTLADLQTSFSLSAVAASIVYALLVRVVGEKAALQRATSSSSPVFVASGDLDTIVTDLNSAIDVQSLEEAVRGGVCEPVDYVREAATTPEQFFRGIDVAPAHISAGLDVLRPEELELVLAGLADRGHVTITGPSGSGKSALLWRAGRIVGRGARTLRIRRVADTNDVDLLVRHVRREQPDAMSPLLVCADDLGRVVMAEWSDALARLREIPSVYVLAAVRREDFSPRIAGDGVVVDARLRETSAAAIYARLVEIGLPLALEPEEGIDRADGLLMEYLSLLRAGTRMREVLDVQVAAMRASGRTLDRHVLRLVCAAHTLGSALHATTLGSHLARLAGWDVSRVGDALGVLEGEYLILQDTMGHWRGLHDLRTETLQRLLHESPPPSLSETFAEVLTLLPHSSAGRALRRAAEQLARGYESAAAVPADPVRRLQDLTELLLPVATAARSILADVDGTSDESRLVIALLEGGERLDCVAYVYALLPRLAARCPPTLELSSLAWLVSAIRNDGIRLPDIAGGPVVNALADSMPARPNTLCSLVGSGLDGARLAMLSRQVPIDRACLLLEASEGAVSLAQQEAREVWEHHVPSVPSPSAGELDLLGAEWRARLSAVLASMADLHGPAVSGVFGATELRASDAIANDPYGVSVVLSTEADDDLDEERWVPAMARPTTWADGILLVASAVVFTRGSESHMPTTYGPQPGAKPGPEEDARRTCQRLLDSCPEVDRADVRAVASNLQLPAAGGHSFGVKTIRSGVLRGGAPVRRNVAFQAAVARALAGPSWSARLRSQAEASHDLVDLLTDLPLRLRTGDNARRRREWHERVEELEHRIVALPSRPLDDDEARALVAALPQAPPSAQDEDERARSADRAKDALSLTVGCLTQASRALVSNDFEPLFGAGARLRDAPKRFTEARMEGAPYFAAVGETLPARLETDVVAASTLLLAVARDRPTRQRIARSRTVDEIKAVIADVSAAQAAVDRTLLLARLDSAGVDAVEVGDLADSKPLLGRLDGGQAVCLVSAADWDRCEEAMTSWLPGSRKGATGHLVVLAVDGDDVLPVGLRLTADSGQALPMLADDVDELAGLLGRVVRRGKVSAYAQSAASDLLAWSTAVTLRGERNVTWTPPPMPDRSPEVVRAELIDALQADASPGSAIETTFDALLSLIGSVAAENGDTPGLAAHLVDALAGSLTGQPDDVALLNLATAAAMEADRPN